MDDFAVTLKARRLSGRLTPDQVPVPMEFYLEAAGDVVVRYDASLASEAAGFTLAVGGRPCIVVNANDSPERQRFTICHELAHIVLNLRTEHADPVPDSGFARRSPNETFCDVFAAELLLPAHIFRLRVEDAEADLDAVARLAESFQASLTATGSRFAAVCDRPCAFVLAQRGLVRYVSRSKCLREAGGWVRPGHKLPDASLAASLRQQARLEGPIELPAAEWFDDWKRGGLVLEDARHLSRWDQTLSLLSFDGDELPVSGHRGAEHDAEEEPALRELDGILPWPGKQRRRP